MTFVEFNEKQVDRLSDFFSNLAVVVAASLIFPFFTDYNLDIKVVIFGLTFSALLFIISLGVLSQK